MRDFQNMKETNIVIRTHALTKNHGDRNKKIKKNTEAGCNTVLNLQESSGAAQIH